MPHTQGTQRGKRNGVQSDPQAIANHVGIEEEVRSVARYLLPNRCPTEIDSQQSHQADDVAQDRLGTSMSA